MDDLPFALFGGLFLGVYFLVTLFYRFGVPEPFGLPPQFWLGLLGFTFVLLMLFGHG